MKFYDSFGMNPRIVRFFVLEKGIELDRQEIDILTGENRREPYLSLNPAGQTPLLLLDDGTPLSETWAICEYLEEKFPEPPLVGRTAEERAVTRMWWRRAEINVCLPMLQGFYFGEGLEIFRERIHCIPEAAEGMKEKGRKALRWFDKLMDGRRWLAGDRFTVADICLYCYVDLLGGAGQPLPEGCSNLGAWINRVKVRPAASASVWREQPMGLTG
ncbi:MAG: glutathione S-transferase family protein [Pseudomonadota bacterium]|nr:glutathione S-transferase family protein [Pseudomonadota bacterium]